jgi:hypothetical protein
MSVSKEAFDILGHSLGVSTGQRGRGLPISFYRNRYCASEGSDNWHLLKELESFGFMIVDHTINSGTSSLWVVTDLGIEFFKADYANRLGPKLTHGNTYAAKVATLAVMAGLPNGAITNVIIRAVFDTKHPDRKILNRGAHVLHLLKKDGFVRSDYKGHWIMSQNIDFIEL